MWSNLHQLVSRCKSRISYSCEASAFFTDSLIIHSSELSWSVDWTSYSFLITAWTSETWFLTSASLLQSNLSLLQGGNYDQCFWGFNGKAFFPHHWWPWDFFLFSVHNTFQRTCEVEHCFGLRAGWIQVRPRLSADVTSLLSDSTPTIQETERRQWNQKRFQIKL